MLDSSLSEADRPPSLPNYAAHTGCAAARARDDAIGDFLESAVVVGDRHEQLGHPSRCRDADGLAELAVVLPASTQRAPGELVVAVFALGRRDEAAVLALDGDPLATEHEGARRRSRRHILGAEESPLRVEANSASAVLFDVTRREDRVRFAANGRERSNASSHQRQTSSESVHALSAILEKTRSLGHRV